MFSTLNFRDHGVIKGATHAQHTFENGWEVSVVAGPKGCGLHGDIQHDTFEVAIIRPDNNMLEDVIGWQTPVQVSTIMRVVSMM
ncbi:MAG: hypothetical protein ACO3CQ_00045 [Candidatus Nanopelagicaceae bacterium]